MRYLLIILSLFCLEGYGQASHAVAGSGSSQKSSESKPQASGPTLVHTVDLSSAASWTLGTGWSVDTGNEKLVWDDTGGTASYTGYTVVHPNTYYMIVDVLVATSSGSPTRVKYRLGNVGDTEVNAWESTGTDIQGPSIATANTNALRFTGLVNFSAYEIENIRIYAE